jgi:lipopolysaccharide export system protein LptA
MNKGSVFFLIGAVLAMPLAAQNASPPAESKPHKKAKKQEAKKQENSGAPNLFGPTTQSNEPTTTEIYSDEAFFDSTKNKGIFSGHVKVIDPRFNLQSEKLTVFISKGQNQNQTQGQNQPAQNQQGQNQQGQNKAETPGQTQGQSQGLEKAIAEGNVAVVRDRPDPNGGPPSRAVGRAETATYIAATGDVELKGDPRVQEGLNTHVAASPDTVMVINQNGQLHTHGPSRTEIRQQPKETPGESPGPTPTPTPKP